MLEGIYPWPDGKVREPGNVNKSELLRAAGYSASYKNGYQIFNRLDYKKGVGSEMEKRRVMRLKEELPDDEQLEKMRKLCNLELLDRLENRPHTISDRDLVTMRKELEKLAPPEDGEGDGKKSRFNVNIQNLVIELDKLIPKESLDAVKARVGIEAEACIEGECVEEDDVPRS